MGSARANEALGALGALPRLAAVAPPPPPPPPKPGIGLAQLQGGGHAGPERADAPVDGGPDRLTVPAAEG